MKFLGALHSLRHNDETHLERGTFLCTNFFLLLTECYTGRTSCAGDPPHIWKMVSPALIESLLWRGLTQPDLFYWDGRKFERPSQFSVGGWVGAWNSKDPLILIQEIEFTWRGAVYLWSTWTNYLSLWLVSYTIGKTGVKHLCGDNEKYDILYIHAVV